MHLSTTQHISLLKVAYISHSCIIRPQLLLYGAPRSAPVFMLYSARNKLTVSASTVP